MSRFWKGILKLILIEYFKIGYGCQKIFLRLLQKNSALSNMMYFRLNRESAIKLRDFQVLDNFLNHKAFKHSKVVRQGVKNVIFIIFSIEVSSYLYQTMSTVNVNYIISWKCCDRGSLSHFVGSKVFRHVTSLSCHTASHYYKFFENTNLPELMFTRNASIFMVTKCFRQLTVNSILLFYSAVHWENEQQ